MAPIRVGLIGLSTAHEFSGAGTWTSSTHLPSLLQSPDYEIVALANSSVESAKRSIAAHGLPPSTKAYESAEDIANDPNVDLVVVSVRVQKHYELAKPALLKGKKVFVEWPLAAKMNEVEELTELAKANGVQTAVVVQARASPMIQKLKDILANGQIGRVLSSSVLASSSNIPMETWSQDLQYYLDMSSGGNEFYISFGHFLDSFTHVLGDLSHIHAILKTQYKTVQILGAENKVVDPAYRKTAPDHILVQGVLDGGAVASLSFRKPKSTAEESGIRWYISGTKGEILITGPAWWQMLDKELELRLKIGDEPAQSINFQEYRVPVAEKVAPVAANVASLYDAFAKGDTTKYATFESAAKTHRLLEEIRQVAYIDK